MKTDNELIAEFMGGWNDNNNSKHLGMNVPADGNPHWEDQWYDYKDMKYHSSWDWLMPVVEKIQSLNYGFSFKGLPAQDGFGGHTIVMFYHAMESRTKHSSGSFIENVYSAAVEFIKWYNESKLSDLSKVIKEK